MRLIIKILGRKKRKDIKCIFFIIFLSQFLFFEWKQLKPNLWQLQKNQIVYFQREDTNKKKVRPLVTGPLSSYTPPSPPPHPSLMVFGTWTVGYLFPEIPGRIPKTIRGFSTIFKKLDSWILRFTLCTEKNSFYLKVAIEIQNWSISGIILNVWDR